jgi:glycosyltransferase involved in cell wall biosynthesis
MGITKVMLYIWRPNFAPYIGKFNEQLLCYHITDDYSFSEIEVSTTKREAYLIRSSDIVFILSRTLLEKKGKLNPNSAYLPNGVDFDFYRKALEQPGRDLPELDTIPRPRVGYTGIIKKQIDLKLLISLAEKKKSWSFILIGPINEYHTDIREDLKSLMKQPNVHFLGAKHQNDMPHYIDALDVCLLCYRETGYTKYIHPLKLWEYLACGKPIVATPLPNLMEFDDVLYYATGLEDWISKIQCALTESSTSIKLKRIRVARQNSWDARIEIITSLLNNTLEKKLALAK